VEIPIFAFDPESRLRLINSAGAKLLQQTSAQLRGKTASELRLHDCLSCENETLVQPPFGNNARWFVRRSSFRQQGVPHTLVVLSDVSRALREEERRAWQRLIRVMGHELNNSLAPIKSIASSLNARLSGSDFRNEEREDFERGLGIIESRAASLNRFLQAYRRLAQTPPPVLRRCSISTLAKRVATLETRAPVTVSPGPDVTLVVDPDQLEQMLINLLRNAAEAALQSSDGGPNSNGKKTSHVEPQIDLTWRLTEKDVVLTIEDNGPGLMNPSNLFVPFYTTKPEGNGIGLVLSRQIAEAHGGSLELSNCIGQRGCTVTVILPLKSSRGSPQAIGQIT
jgi:two-component system nitrogen regulation sensor histidine kinase NtrY